MPGNSNASFDSHQIDRHVGRRIRERRLTLGMSQERLGQALGVSYQQVQKYEQGVNRLSAGRLYHVARVLGVPMLFFFENLRACGDDEALARQEDTNAEISDRLLIAASAAFQRIPEERIRQHIVLLMRALGEPQQDKPRSLREASASREQATE